MVYSVSGEHQESLMQLPPQELQDNLTTAFAALQATCKEPEVVSDIGMIG
jgi:hypothetical protein